MGVTRRNLLIWMWEWMYTYTIYLQNNKMNNWENLDEVMTLYWFYKFIEWVENNTINLDNL